MFKIIVAVKIHLLLAISCGEQCRYDCKITEIPTDCSILSASEIKRYDDSSIRYLEDKEYVKALAILNCFSKTEKLFTDVRKLRWLTTKFESYGFDTLTGILGVFVELANLINSGSTTVEKLPGVPDINQKTQADYFTLVSELKVVFQSINTQALDQNQKATYSSLSTVLAIFILNSYAYPNTLIGPPYIALATGVGSADESFVKESLICALTDPADQKNCPNGVGINVSAIALVLANAFYSQ